MVVPGQLARPVVAGADGTLSHESLLMIVANDDASVYYHYHTSLYMS